LPGFYTTTIFCFSAGHGRFARAFAACSGRFAPAVPAPPYFTTHGNTNAPVRQFLDWNESGIPDELQDSFLIRNNFETIRRNSGQITGFFSDSKQSRYTFASVKR